VPGLLARAAELPDATGPGLKAALRDVIGVDPVLIHVYRPDVVDQAVSFWRAVQTGVWRTGDRAMSTPVYSHDAIRYAVDLLTAQERGWRAWAETEDVEIRLSLSYPVLWRNLTFFCGTILDALGLDSALAPRPALTRQGDAENAEWAARFRAGELAVLP
jgi:LPS sulfotransferase NodH